MHSQGAVIMNTESKAGNSPRLLSLDVLRGFDMFWIIAGYGVVANLNKLFDSRFSSLINQHMHHCDWDGFTAYDLIFPLFIFIAGVAMSFSIISRLERGQSRLRIYLRIIRRSVLLILLGLLYNGLLKFDFANLRYPSVLGFIGIAYFWASIIVIHLKVRGQVIAVFVILIFYCLAMMFIPVPGHGPGVLTKEGNLASHIDRILLPGRLHEGVFDPEGLLMTIPGSVLAILGALSGSLLRSRRFGGYKKVLLLMAAGLVSLAVGRVWGLWFPIIKKLWTSSYILYAAGWSFLLLACFYLIVDVWKIRRPLFPFTVIGMNSIIIYIAAHRAINFSQTADFFFAGFIKTTPGPLQPVLTSLGLLIVELLFLYLLYRKKIFLKV